MNTSSGNPFNYSSAMAKNNGLMANSSSRMALDNLLRRELKVSDPNDAKQIAEALLNRYKNNPRALAINKEAEGVPFLLASGTPMPLQQAPTSSDAEMKQAIDDVERDLRELTTNSILKDVTLELEGWAMAVRSAIQEGVNSARFALDPRQRDKTFGIRRTLGDYARLARLVGALTPTMSLIYRKFAQSLDEVASVLLVMMGEALANVGFSGGKYLLQAPYSELQVRRDTVIYSLRNLVGATQEAYGPNEWPRGLEAYREIFLALEQQGQGDLRVLLVENELSRIMDALIQRAGQGSVEGLRQLGATAQLDLERLHRLVTVGTNAVSPSPPLTAFLQALSLFVEAFKPSGGFRLLRLARPPILFYGLYGMSVLGKAEERMLNLVLKRNLLADKLDCYMQCGCTPEQVKSQIKLDKILYDLDRAIDLYAVGKDDEGKGEPEYRAVAYSYIVDVVLFPDSADTNILGCLQKKTNPIVPAAIQMDNGLRTFLQEVVSLLPTQENAPNPLNQDILDYLLEVRKLLLATVHDLTSQEYNQFLKTLEDYKAEATKIPLVNQELEIQKLMEEQWENLVKTMAPSCIQFNTKELTDMIDEAKKRTTKKPQELKTVALPPNYEESLKIVAEKLSPKLGESAQNLAEDFDDLVNDNLSTEP